MIPSTENDVLRYDTYSEKSKFSWFTGHSFSNCSSSHTFLARLFSFTVSLPTIARETPLRIFSTKDPTEPRRRPSKRDSLSLS